MAERVIRVLKPRVSIEQARQQMDAIGARIAGEHPDSSKGWSIAVDRYADSIVGPQTRTSLLALMAAVGGLLLICCSNLMSLMFMRTVSKQGEIAVRAVLGAGWLRLVRQLALEYFVMTFGGSVLGIRTLERIKTVSAASGRLQTALISTFSTVALLLAAIGMYGVLAYSVALRVHEIGIRAALGASSSTLLAAVLGRGLSLTIVGLAIGFVAALSLTPLLSSVLYKVEARDPYLMAGVATILVLVSMLACAIPARRAGKVDPVIALRGE
jgi:ABC-type antimicrobial peptide transport system permease subunit